MINDRFLEYKLKSDFAERRDFELHYCRHGVVTRHPDDVSPVRPGKQARTLTTQLLASVPRTCRVIFSRETI